VPGVNPTIEAAWIAAGVGGLGIAGAVTTAIVGFLSTRNATTKTVAAGTASTTATLAAAREERLWERQAAAYEETIAALLHRQMKRQHELRMYRLTEDAEQQLKDFFASYEPPGWFQAQARLLAYASDDVRDAFEATRRADGEVRVRCDRWMAMSEQARLAVASGRPNAAPEGSVMVQARRDVNPALEEAEAKDEAVIKLIRDKLRSKPESIGMTLEPSARRRRWGH
jgi:hypothetical protein